MDYGLTIIFVIVANQRFVTKEMLTLPWKETIIRWSLTFAYVALVHLLAGKQSSDPQSCDPAVVQRWENFFLPKHDKL